MVVVASMLFDVDIDVMMRREKGEIETEVTSFWSKKNRDAIVDDLAMHRAYEVVSPPRITLFCFHNHFDLVLPSIS